MLGMTRPSKAEDSIWVKVHIIIIENVKKVWGLGIKNIF